jgi:ABC-type phosphate transport system substrate-binding protein
MSTSETSTATSKNITPAFLPFGTGAVAIVVALTVLHPDGTQGLIQGLHLTMATLAKIFTGRITSWDTKEIFDENPSLQFELQHIKQVPPTIDATARSDSSSTNSALLAALRADPAADAFLTGLGVPAEGIPPDQFPPNAAISDLSGGSALVAEHMLKINPNTGVPSNAPAASIGYLGLAWAAQFHIPLVAVQNLKGNFVAASEASLTPAMSGQTFDSSTGLYPLSKTYDYSTIQDPNAYPIPLPNYLVVPKTGDAPAKENALAAYVKYAVSTPGQQDVTYNGMIGVGSDVATAANSLATTMLADAATTTTTSTSSTSTSTSTSAPTSTSTTTAASATSTTSTLVSATTSTVHGTTTTTTGRTSAAALGGSQSGGGALTGGATLPITGAAPTIGFAGLVAVIVGDVVRRRARRSPG